MMDEHPAGPPEVVFEELDRRECLQLLASTTLGRIAVAVPGWSFPVIRPVNFAFDATMNAVVFRSMRGSKLTALLLSHAAAFEVDWADEVAKEGWSVVDAGQVEEIEQPLHLDRAASLGLDPWAPGDKPHWLCIRTEMATGRRIRRRQPRA